MNFILDNTAKGDKHIIFEEDFNSLDIWENEDYDKFYFSFKTNNFELFFAIKNEDIIKMKSQFEELLEVEKLEWLRSLNTPKEG